MKRILLIFLLGTTFILPVQAQIPQTISYQGVLTDLSGNPVADGNYNLSFKLYTVSTGGTALWTETKSVAVSKGVFSTILGSVTALNLPFDQKYWLGTTVGTGAELTPRIELTSSAYSLNARTVADGQVVKSLNNLKDNIKIVQGSNVSVTTAGDSISISASAQGNTLDQSYDQGGTGAGRIITADAGPVEIQGSGGFRVEGVVTIFGSGFEGGEVALTDGDGSFSWRMDNFGNSSEENLRFFRTDGLENALVLSRSGKVGIGTGAPITKLQVADTIYASSGGFMFPDGSVQTTAATGGGANTLDEAYDQGGLGAGRIITADAGAFEVGGVDGAVFKGTYNSGIIPVTGAGTRMMWYPKKGAFRVGAVDGTEWDDANIGDYSIGMGNSTTASGYFSTAFGVNTIASGYNSTAMGFRTIASGQISTAMGYYTTAGGDYSMVIGQGVDGSNRLINGFNSSLMIGFNSTIPTLFVGPSSGAGTFGKVGIGTSTPTTALQVSDTIYSSSGGFKFPDGSVQTTAATGGGNTLDQSYDQGGAGAGRTITADAGAVNITGSDGLTVNGNIGIGTTTPNALLHTVLDNFGDHLRLERIGASPSHYTVNLSGDVINHISSVDQMFETDTDTIMTITRGGKVGIGISAPTTALQVADIIYSSSGGFKFPDGSVQTTAASGGNTLDQAYDQGGSGAGRVITADAGALEVGGVDGAVFTGTVDNGTIPATGAGVRMMWYPKKGAIRSGRVTSTQWDDMNTGYYSTASGYNTTASSTASTALGYGTIASGLWSTAMGGASVASGGSATAMGNGATASGGGSTAMGYYTNAIGAYSTAMGYYAKAKAYASVAIGRYNDSTGTADSWVATDPLFVIGNGTMYNNLSNAMTVLKNGKVGIVTISPTAQLDVGGVDGAVFTGTYGSGTIPVEGAGVRMMWYPKKAAFRAGYDSGILWNDSNIGEASVAMGLSLTASGYASTALGRGTTASGVSSTAMGVGTTASGDSSTAMGSRVSTNGYAGSFIIGDNSTATTTSSSAARQMTMRFAGGYRLFSNSGLTAGVTLAAGGGSWSSVSDYRKKENFKPENSESVLMKISRMPILNWNYKSQSPSIRHLGPTAQDFFSAFQLGESDTTITTTDIDGINLLAIQALEKRTTELNLKVKELETLRTELSETKTQLVKMQEVVSKLVNQVKKESPADLRFVSNEEKK